MAPLLKFWDASILDIGETRRFAVTFNLAYSKDENFADAKEPSTLPLSLT
jgi:hypothetical protein